MRMRLKAAGNMHSPERALELLRQLQRHRIHLTDDQTVIGLSSVSAEQAELFTSLKLPPSSTPKLRKCLISFISEIKRSTTNLASNIFCAWLGQLQ